MIRVSPDSMSDDTFIGRVDRLMPPGPGGRIGTIEIDGPAGGAPYFWWNRETVERWEPVAGTLEVDEAQFLRDIDRAVAGLNASVQAYLAATARNTRRRDAAGGGS